MRLFLKHIVIILLVFFGVSSIISVGSLWALRQGSFYKPPFLANAVKQTNFDYIILGSSTGLTTLNTQVIDSILNIEGLNLSMDDTALSSQYLMLQHFLAEGKSTKVCVLASNASTYDRNYYKLSDNDYRFLMYVNRPYVSTYYKHFSSTDANLLSLSEWLPMLGVSYYNTEIFYPSLLSFIKPEKRNRFDNKGNYTYPVVKNQAKPITHFTDMHIGFTNTNIERIKTLCELHNIQLICYLSPMKGRKAVMNTSEFIIINHSNLLTNTDHFYDDIHVNYLGRQLSSIRFSEDFQELTKIEMN